MDNDNNKKRFDSYVDPVVALDKFKPHLYNLVILDIRMPDLNGFALYREIKRLDKKVKICFLPLENQFPTTECIQIYSLHFLSIVSDKKFIINLHAHTYV